MIKILDAHALMVFLEKEPGAKKVQHFFTDSIKENSELLMSAVNYGEVCYIILRECGRKKLEEIENLIRTLPINIVSVDVWLAREAANFKAGNKLSYADCFAAALARIHKGGVITGDKEFKVLEREIKILWID